jgi:hypothetical protein
MSITNHYNTRRQKVFVTKNEAHASFYTTSLLLTPQPPYAMAAI